MTCWRASAAAPISLRTHWGAWHWPCGRAGRPPRSPPERPLALNSSTSWSWAVPAPCTIAGREAVMARYRVILAGGDRSHQEQYARQFQQSGRCELVAVTDAPDVSAAGHASNRALAERFGVP